MWYKFHADNATSMYGYGSSSEASAYAAQHGRGLAELADDDAEASRMAGVVDIASEGVTLSECVLSWCVDCIDGSPASRALRDWRSIDRSEARIKAEEWRDRGALGISGANAHGDEETEEL